ncbi:MAG: hypothetical protein U0Q15_07810 [Kineosporiaceae bacterium]
MSVHDLLDDVADAALAPARGVDVDAVLVRARVQVRAARRRRAGAGLLAAASVAVLAVGLQAGTGALLRGGGGGVAAPAQGPARVPSEVFVPPAWTAPLASRPLSRAVYAVQALTTTRTDAADVPALVSADDGQYRTLPWTDADHDLVLGPDGTRAAWVRDAGTGTPGDLVVLLDVTRGSTQVAEVPSPSGQGAQVRSLAFAPDGGVLAVQVSEPVGTARERVLVRPVPERAAGQPVTGAWQGAWTQVCACEGPVSFADDGTLLVGPGRVGAAVDTPAGTLPVRVGGAPVSVSGPTSLGMDGPGVRLRVGGTDLVLDAADGPARLLTAAGAQVLALPDVAARAPGMWHTRVAAVAGRQVVVSRVVADAQGRGLAGAVQRADLDASPPAVRTLTRVEGGAVVVSAAGGLLEGDLQTVTTAAPARAADPAWWRYQAGRSAGDVLGAARVAWPLLALGVAGAGLLWWRRRAVVPAPAAGWARFRTAAVGSGHGLTARVPVWSRRRWVGSVAVCAVALAGGTTLLVIGTLAEGDLRQAEQDRRDAMVTPVVVPDQLAAWPTAAAFRSADARPTRVSMLLLRQSEGGPALAGVDAGTGRVVSLEGVGASRSAAGLSGEGGASFAGMLALSPGGRVVAQVRARTLVVVNLDDGRVRRWPLSVDVTPADGQPGTLSQGIAVNDDGTVLAVSGQGALWRIGAGGEQVELKRFGQVLGVAAQTSGRFLLWRRFPDATGPARLDVVDAATGSVANYMTWPADDVVRPVATETASGSIVLRTDDGRLLLHDLDTPSVELGRLPQIDWIGAGTDSSLVSLTAPEDRLATGATVSLGAWPGLQGPGVERPEALRATAAGGPGVVLTRIGLPDALVALAPAALAEASPVQSPQRPGRFGWAVEGTFAHWLVPVATWSVLAGLLGLVLLALRAARPRLAGWGRAASGRISPRRNRRSGPS